jgi:4-aminobutyrate aminotransferase-like enzyme
METLERLRRYESRNITYFNPAGGWPIVWESARGVWVVDEQGRRYLDLTAAFGVAATGHANPGVVAAARRQMSKLLHAMGDVHPHALKARLAEELVLLSYGRWCPTTPDLNSSAPGKVVFGTSGSEAVEIALKTAFLATGRPGIIAFEGAYHGLGYGALAGTHRDHFRGHFRDQLREFGRFVPYPRCGRCSCDGRSCADLAGIEGRMDAIAAGHPVGAVLVEPIQARGGIRIPSSAFLPMLRRWCDRNGALLILDEIYTGFGRTGTWFATEQWGVIPDLICLGKALTGGFPLSACVGRTEVMDAWPVSQGEAIHTSTYLGHPVGCAMALAQIAELQRLNGVEAARQLGMRVERYWERFPRKLGSLTLLPRNRGLMIGIEIMDSHGAPAASVALTAVQKLLERGFIFLPEGEWGEVISLTPPLTISWRQLKRALDAVLQVLQELTESNPAMVAGREGISST